MRSFVFPHLQTMTQHRRFSLPCRLLVLGCLVALARGFSSTTSRNPLLPNNNDQNLALITGGTGRTGQIVTRLLLERGFAVRLLARNVTQAQQTLAPLLERYNDNNNVIEFCQGQLGDAAAMKAAFAGTNDDDKKITHIVFCAGGDGADYRAVNYQGVVDCVAQIASSSTLDDDTNNHSIEQMVLISTAWASRPYSIASLLFNTLFDTIPMACHFLGEEAVRRAARDGRLKNYVILRAGGLNSDERFAQKYPDVDTTKLTYQQGDEFDFLGKAGRPGMCRSQLAQAVATAVAQVDGCYTVEVTGSGEDDVNDPTVYQQRLKQDDWSSMISSEEEIFAIHTQAIQELRNVGIAATVGGLAFIVVFGWVQGLLSLVAMDAAIIWVWSQFYANRQT